MVKIKRKVQKNLPQLIDWAWENDITNKEYVCNEHKVKSVIFNLMGWAEFNDEFSYNPHNTFTVEVEEVVTEKTEFELMIEITDGCPNCLWEEASVEDWKDEDSKEFHAYIDGEFKLIWTHEKGMVE